MKPEELFLKKCNILYINMSKKFSLSLTSVLSWLKLGLGCAVSIPPVFAKTVLGIFLFWENVPFSAGHPGQLFKTKTV